MKTRTYGIGAVMALAVIGLAGCSTTVENPPSTETHTTTVLPGKETHTNTVVPVPGPATHTETNTNTTTVVPGADSSGGSSTSRTDSSTTKSP